MGGESEIIPKSLKYCGNSVVHLKRKRSCDDANCDGESFVGPARNGGYYTDHELETLTLNVSDNRYLQYKLYLETNVATHTPKLYNVSIEGITVEVVSDPAISEAWIDFNGENVSMSGSGYSWSYVNSSLDTGTYDYIVYANDTFGNLNFTDERTFTVPSYNITFNVVSGEDGHGLNDTINISCNYTGFDQNGDDKNPYGPYEFPAGTWQCTFDDISDPEEFWDETINFIANASQTINVVMSLHGGLSYEEHSQLDWLYNCWKNGDCTAYTLLSEIHENVSKIWQEFLPTDESVVTQEDILSNALSASSNISINYTIDIPFKEGFDDGDLLPLRIFFWFTDGSGNCFSQDKQADSNRAESPFCTPLLAEYLGPNNGSVSFKVDLHPDLPDGTYSIVRSIDIDPPVNGEPVWINYGREIIGSIEVINNVLSSGNDEKVTSDVAVETGGSTIPTLNAITGKVVDTVKNPMGSPLTMLVGLAMVCLTILGTVYMRQKRRW